MPQDERVNVQIDVTTPDAPEPKYPEHEKQQMLRELRGES